MARMAYAEWSEPADPFGAVVVPFGEDRFYAVIFVFCTGTAVPCDEIDGSGGGLSEFHRKIGSRPFRIAHPTDIVWEGGGPRRSLLPEDDGSGPRRAFVSGDVVGHLLALAHQACHCGELAA